MTWTARIAPLAALLLGLVAFAGLGATACGGDECSGSEAVCLSKTKIKECKDGKWVERTCPTVQTCMTMGTPPLTHCM